MSHRRYARPAIALIVLTLASTGCAVGARPTLAEVAPVDDAAAAAVINRLERPPTFGFTATYAITPSSTNEATRAVITRDATGRITAEIGDIVYTTFPDGRTTTCDLGSSNCLEYGNDARISDLGITHRFWGADFKQRLITDSQRRIGASTGSFTTIADHPATCVAVKVPSSIEAVGTVNYCALDVGVLGRYYGADVVIELASFEKLPDAP